MYTYKQTEFSPYRLFTVGYNDPKTGWEPESDHETSEAAAERAVFLNGGGDTETARKLAEAQSALAALMEYTLGLAATELRKQDYFKFCDHPTVKTAQKIIAQNSARG